MKQIAGHRRVISHKISHQHRNECIKPNQSGNVGRVRGLEVLLEDEVLLTIDSS